MGKRFYERTTYAVWEVTLKCNLACSHCGSRAAQARINELTTEEALDLVHQLAEVGINEVTLIGGEAYLRRDWLEIAREITRSGMICTVVTGGLGISAQVARRMKEAGIRAVSVSVDGLRDTHDELRGVPGSWDACFRTVGFLKEAGIPFSFNTQINRKSWKELPELYTILRDAGMDSWQFQLTAPMGKAADHAELLLQPYELLDLFPLLAEIAEQAVRDGVRPWPGDNVGYFSPYDNVLHGRDGSRPALFTGCEAGASAIGIQADGIVKACPSLPTESYAGANIRNMRLAEIMAFTEPLQFNKIERFTQASVAHLWGFCATCRFKKFCRGGCTWTAHLFFGRRGNNPYCHHRALEYDRQGFRERLVCEEAPPGVPFDHGIFKSIVEPRDAPLPENPWDPQALAFPVAVEVKDGAGETLAKQSGSVPDGIPSPIFSSRDAIMG